MQGDRKKRSGVTAGAQRGGEDRRRLADAGEGEQQLRHQSDDAPPPPERGERDVDHAARLAIMRDEEMIERAIGVEIERAWNGGMIAPRGDAESLERDLFADRVLRRIEKDADREIGVAGGDRGGGAARG